MDAIRVNTLVDTYYDTKVGCDNEWVLGTTAQGITEKAGVAVSQNEWTLSITAQDITQSVGVTVAQGSVTGTLKTALTGAGTVSVVVSTAAGTTFVSGVEVVIGTTSTVVAGNVNTATKTVAATGTLSVALQNEWTMAITAQGITENAGVTVTQGRACKCMDCGTAVVNAALTSGSCTVATDTCSAGISGAGCYTGCATSCDCATSKCSR